MFRIVCLISKQSPLGFQFLSPIFLEARKCNAFFVPDKTERIWEIGKETHSSVKSPLSFRLPIVSHQMCKLLPTTLQQDFFQPAIPVLVIIQKSHILTLKFHTQCCRYRYSFCHVQFSGMSKAAKKEPDALHFMTFNHLAKFIISQQPMFPWRGVPFLSYLLGAQNTCEVTKIWPETFWKHSDFATHVSVPGYSTVRPLKRTTTLYVSAPRIARIHCEKPDNQNHPSCDGKITVDSMGKKNILKRSRVYPAVLDYCSGFFWLLGPWSKEFRMCPFGESSRWQKAWKPYGIHVCHFSIFFRDLLVKSSTSSMISSQKKISKSRSHRINIIQSTPKFFQRLGLGCPRIYRGQQQFFGIQTSEGVAHFWGSKTGTGWGAKPIEKGPGLRAVEVFGSGNSEKFLDWFTTRKPGTCTISQHLSTVAKHTRVFHSQEFYFQKRPTGQHVDNYQTAVAVGLNPTTSNQQSSVPSLIFTKIPAPLLPNPQISWGCLLPSSVSASHHIPSVVFTMGFTFPSTNCSGPHL